MLRTCNRCGRVIGYNSYFHAYVCPFCGNHQEVKTEKTETINRDDLIKGLECLMLYEGINRESCESGSKEGCLRKIIKDVLSIINEQQELEV